MVHDPSPGYLDAQVAVSQEAQGAKEQKVSSPYLTSIGRAFPFSSTSVPEVGERVRAYLEQHGWPEEFLLEHYAFLAPYVMARRSTFF